MQTGVGKALSRGNEEFSEKQQQARNLKLATFGGRSYQVGSSFGYAAGPQKMVKSFQADEGSEALQSRCDILFKNVFFEAVE